jgi:protein-S-isoprenylcysteine O-methyltransferase Ste14
MGLLLFLPAWSLRWWQAWLYWVVFIGASLFVTLYFLRRDPDLIERRLAAGPVAEPERSQKALQSALSIVFAALLAVPGFDHRLHWSAVPLPLTLVADAFVAAGFWLIFRVFRENSFASNTVRVEPGQEVMSTGPYSLIRHPMYAGGLVLLLFTPLALGSWWAFIPGVLLCGGVVIRLLGEERLLTAHLGGYAEYRQKVPHRLIPFVW